MSYLQAFLPLIREAIVPIGFAAAGLGLLVALVAIISPNRFEQLCDLSNKWIKTPLQVSRLDQQVADPEQLARRYVRLTGTLILVLATTLAITVSGL